MATINNRNNRNEDQDAPLRGGERHSSVPNDLPDSVQDQEKLQPEETVINLPDVSDIPGQENVTVPQMESFMDTTIASADEEGDHIFSADNEVGGDEQARTSMGQDDPADRSAGNVVDGTP